VRAFEEAGATVEEVSLGIQRDQRELSDLWCRLVMWPNIETLEGFKANGLDLIGDHRDDFPPEYLRWVDEAYTWGLPGLARDHQMRTEIYDAIQAVFADYDLLVTPTVPYDPPAARGPLLAEVEGKRQPEANVGSFTMPFNLSWHPAATVRCGFSRAGLPVGLQIIGPRHRDDLVLQAAYAFEKARPWAHDWPTV